MNSALGQLARLNIMKLLQCAPTAHSKTSCQAYQANYVCVLMDDNNQAKFPNNMTTKSIFSSAQYMIEKIISHIQVLVTFLQPHQ